MTAPSQHSVPIRPDPIRPGDTVAVVSLSSAAAHLFPHRYEAGVRQLRELLGVEVVASEHARAAPDVLAAHPELRAADLHAALRDPAVTGIVSAIGGDDSIRLIPHLDLELIAAHPKPFIGFSDTTVTHMAFLAAGVTSYYGPSLLAGFAENAGMHQYTMDGVRRALTQPAPMGTWLPNEDGWTVERLEWGDASLQSQARTLRPSTGWRWLQGGEQTCRGTLVAGCVEVLDWLRGTPLWPSLDHAVLAIETSEEAPTPQAVARMLRAIAAASDGFSGLQGLLVGRPGGADMDPARHGEYDDAVLSVVRGELGLTDMPVICGMDFGHTDPMWTLPIGQPVEIDCTARRVTFP